MKEAETFLLWQGWNSPWCLARERRATTIFSPGLGMNICWEAGLNLQLPPWYFSSQKQLSPENKVAIVSALPTHWTGIHTYNLCEEKKKKEKWFPVESVWTGQSYQSIFCFFNIFIIPVQAGQFVHVIGTNSLQSYFTSMQMFFVAFSKSVHSQIIGSSSLGSASSTSGRLLAPGFPFWSCSVTWGCLRQRSWHWIIYSRSFFLAKTDKQWFSHKLPQWKRKQTLANTL